MKFWKIPYWQLLLGPTLCFVFGFFLNWLCMWVNGGQMPVLIPSGACDQSVLGHDEHYVHIWQCLTANTHLKFLADVIYSRTVGGMESIGDVFMDVYYNWFYHGLFAWCALMVRDLKEYYALRR
jgi:hypothetical protein